MSDPLAGDWMQTYTGLAFHTTDPSSGEIDPTDIAHSLSLLCRYGGHVDRFYSVAEHCVLMSRAVSSHNALWALLHDAGEAYLGDVIRPLKQALPDYRVIEDRVERAIFQRFALTGSKPDEVSEADIRILYDERAALISRPYPLPWRVLRGYTPLGVDIHCWPPHVAEREFTHRLDELWPGDVA